MATKKKAKPKKAKAKKPKPKPKRKSPTLKSQSSSRAPRGFKRVERALPRNIEAMQTTAANQQRYSLQGAARLMDESGQYNTSVHVHKNRDGTVDGELRVFNIRRRYKINDVLIDLAEAIYGTPSNPSEFRLPEGHWVSLGGLTDWGGSKVDWEEAYQRAKKKGATDSEARQIASAASSPLPRYRGLDRVALYPQRAIELPAQVFRAQQGLLGEEQRDAVTGRKLGRKHRTKPQEILLRVYWNPWNITPANVGGRGGTKRRRRSSN